jgi:maleylpyruvate isomerase
MMQKSGFVLHGFWRSSTSFRVRVALDLKGIDYTQKTYRLREGDQRHPDYLAVNPQGLVPSLVTPNGLVLTQSLAIMEWLDETFPEPALLPTDANGRARVRALAQAVALDIHPINNLRVLFHLRDKFAADDKAQAEWFRHWATSTLSALEKTLASSSATGTFCHGDTLSLADICLVGQSVNNKRFEVDESQWPTISCIVATCLTLPAFQAALPAKQPDAVA